MSPEERAYLDGHQAGLDGKPPTSPHHGGPKYHAWQRGHAHGAELRKLAREKLAAPRLSPDEARGLAEIEEGWRK